MREETLIDAVNDIDTIARLTEDLYDKYYNNEPDYWEKLKHQATIDFMKSFLDKYDGTVNIESLLSNAIKLATALVNRLKEE
jgi:hypothetical protein